MLENEEHDFSLSHVLSLRDQLKKIDIDITTEINDPHVVLELHENAYSDRVYNGVPLIGYAVETEYFHPENYDKSLLERYNKFFHFDDRFIKSHSFVKKTTEPRHLSHRYFAFEVDGWGQRDIYIVNVSRNKNYKVHCPDNGYDLRYDLISYFINRYMGSEEKKIRLYGGGWDHPRKRAGLLNHYIFRIVEKFQLGRLNPLLHSSPLRAAWRGEPARKSDVLNRAKFCLAIENLFSREGYVTEKIFDSIRCGAVPIVKGRPQTVFEIPEDLYINLDNFPNLDKLASYLDGFSEIDYEFWLSKREKFISGGDYRAGTAEFWASNIVNSIRTCLTNS